MSWSREQVELLLNEYSKYPALYAVKDKNYKNKHARINALLAVQTALSVIKPQVTIEEIKSKFHGLKNTFVSEHKKHLRSLKTGTGEDNIYIPTIWYYNKMDFVLEHCTVRQATDAISEIHNSTTVVVNEVELPEGTEVEVVEDSDNEDDLNLPSHSATPTSAESETQDRQVTRLKRKRAGMASQQAIIAEATSTLRQISSAIKQNQEVRNGGNYKDIFAQLVAARLQQMDDRKREDVEKKIITLLYD